MEPCIAARALRLRYGVSLAELARASGVSPQLLSQIELGLAGRTPHHEQLLRNAFAAVIALHRERLNKLEQELADSPELFRPAKEVSEHDL